MSLTHALALAARDPATFARKALARSTAALPFFPRQANLRLGDVRFECDFTLGPRVRDMYFGAYEPEEVALVLGVLEPGDTFVDVGANIGYFTALAASRVGVTGRVHAFEPVPEYCARLTALRDRHPRHQVEVNAAALGDAESTARIEVAGRGNLGWNTLVPGFMAPGAAAASYSVRVRRLDGYLAERGVERIALLKVDVEGFELPALRGLTGWLERVESRPIILCEVAPDAYPKLGARVEDLFELLARFGYRATDVTRRARPLRAAELEATTNVVFRAG